MVPVREGRGKWDIIVISKVNFKVRLSWLNQLVILVARLLFKDLKVLLGKTLGLKLSV